MILLDENVPESQRLLLRSWRIRVRQIGYEVGSRGLQDEAIIPLLRELTRPTLFTRDSAFYHRRLLHARYCLAWLDVSQYEVATFIRRFLRHSAFDTEHKRMGTVVRGGHTGIRAWRQSRAEEEVLPWEN